MAGLLRAGIAHPVSRAEACEVKICMPHRRKSGLARFARILLRSEWLLLKHCKKRSATAWFSERGL